MATPIDIATATMSAPTLRTATFRPNTIMSNISNSAVCLVYVDIIALCAIFVKHERSKRVQYRLQFSDALECLPTMPAGSQHHEVSVVDFHRGIQRSGTTKSHAQILDSTLADATASEHTIGCSKVLAPRPSFNAITDLLTVHVIACCALYVNNSIALVLFIVKPRACYS